MLVLKGRRQTVVIAGGGASECMLKVTVIKVHGGRVKLGLEVPAGIRIQRRETWATRGAAGPPCHPDARPAASKQESDRWEDDGGGPGSPGGIPAVLHAVMRLAQCRH